jgi:hypothetical protein
MRRTAASWAGWSEFDRLRLLLRLKIPAMPHIGESGLVLPV